MTETLTIKVGTFIVVILVAIAGVTLALVLTYYLAKRSAQHERRQQWMKQSRSTIKGQLSEQIAPFLPGFPKDLKPSEAKFLGQPVDFLFFKGMDEKNITRVVFLEVKTGKSSLNPNERKLRDAIRQKSVEWREYTVPEEILAAAPAPLSARKTFASE